MSNTKVVLPTKGPLLSGKGWTAFFVTLIVVCAVAPVLNMVVPAGSPLHMSDYAVALVGKIMCYACLLYTSPSPRDRTRSRMPSSA